MQTRKLEGWKEIAGHFGVGVRTVQLWEAERGLPVHRAAGPRGRVWAETAELDAWRSRFDRDPPAAPAPRPAARWRWIAAATLLTALGVGSWVLRMERRRQPAGFNITGQRLNVLDEQGRTLFSHDFPAPPFRDWEYSDYHANRPGTVELDGDGDREFIFPWRRGEVTPETDELLCFSRDGSLRWSFPAGRKVATTAGEEFAPPFTIGAYAQVRLPGGETAIVVSTHHRLLYPAQIALLDARGRLLREYWHSGQLNSLLAADFNADGMDEIYAGGCANGPRMAALVALDPLTMAGASREDDPRYQIQGFPAPVEMARLLFRRTRASENTQVMNAVLRVSQESDLLRVEVEEFREGSFAGSVYHTLRRDLSSSDVQADNNMALHYDRLVKRDSAAPSLAEEMRRVAEPVWLTRPRR
jgi:hypothetical protein